MYSLQFIIFVIGEEDLLNGSQGWRQYVGVFTILMVRGGTSYYFVACDFFFAPWSLNNSAVAGV